MKKNKFTRYKSAVLLIVILFIISIASVLITCGKVTAPGDVGPPSIPENFTLIGGGDGQVHFRWSRNLEPDFDKYIIYRSIDNSNDFINIAETRQTEFVDQFLDYDRTYYYYITAVDYAGNESNGTGILDVSPVNVSSPPSPTSVVVMGHNYPVLNQIELVIPWLPPNISDIWKHRIYRGTSEDFPVNTSTLIDSTILSIMSDKNVKPGDFYYYKIVSVDLGAKQSAPSKPGGDRILENLYLTSPSNRSVASSPVQFLWKSVQNAINYQLFVARAPLSDIIWTSPKIQNTQITYGGTNLLSGVIYYWWVGAYSKNDYVTEDGIQVKPDVNSRSEVWTFFVR